MLFSKFESWQNIVILNRLPTSSIRSFPDTCVSLNIAINLTICKLYMWIMVAVQKDPDFSNRFATMFSTYWMFLDCFHICHPVKYLGLKSFWNHYNRKSDLAFLSYSRCSRYFDNTMHPFLFCVFERWSSKFRVRGVNSMKNNKIALYSLTYVEFE